MNDAPDTLWAMGSDDGWLAPYCGLIPCEGAIPYDRRADLPAPPLSDPRVVALVEKAQQALPILESLMSHPGDGEWLAGFRSALEAAKPPGE